MAEITKTKPHTLMLDNRKKLVITGAEDVNGFNEDAVSVKTTDGTLIKGGRYAVYRQRLKIKAIKAF